MKINKRIWSRWRIALLILVGLVAIAVLWLFGALFVSGYVLR